MRTIPLLLLSMLALACSSGNDAKSPGALHPTWSIQTADQARGLGVAPGGDVFFAVGNNSGAFADTGGLMVVGPGGAVRAELPLEVPRLCEDCTRLIFDPGMPHIVGNTAWVMDKQGNLFRVDLDGLDARHVPLTGWNQVSGIAGLDRHSALSPDGKRAYLTGVELVVLALESGTVEATIDFGSLVRSIAHLHGDNYLLDLTEPLGDEGRLAVWNAESNELVAEARTPWPVVAISVEARWAVAAIEIGTGEYALLELEHDLSDLTPLSGFTVPPGPIHLALLPEERIVVAGSGGIQIWGPTAEAHPGTTVVIDADEGPLVDLETSSVKALSFSHDRSSLYVADTGGLKAFTLPD